MVEGARGTVLDECDAVGAVQGRVATSSRPLVQDQLLLHLGMLPLLCNC